mgnify:CR=1 FL=1|tara:strand:+ start:324 stop:587 length:264 start_codon:yes stop_codon:yes gene_type:complete
MAFIEIILGIVVLLLVTSCYVIWNLTNKQEMLEDWISNFMETIEKIDFDLNQVDYLGAFEADDETGVIFKEIKKTLKQLNDFKGEEQ